MVLLIVFGIIFIIYFYIYLRKKEHFKCKYLVKPKNPNCFYRHNYNKNIYPIKRNIQGNNLFKTSQSTITNNDFEKILFKIQKKKINHTYKNMDISLLKNNMKKNIHKAENIILNKVNDYIYIHYKSLYCSSYNICKASIINTEIVKLKTYKHNNNYHYQYDFLTEIYIKNRKKSYIIHVVIEDILNKISINSICLVGNNWSDTINHLPGIDKKNNLVQIYSKGKHYNTHANYYKNSTEKTILIDKKKIINIIKGKGNNCGFKCGLTNGYMCYGNKAFNKNDCEINKKGYWDKPCIKNTDCPFYRANKNYFNNRGGCFKGWCEMPLGVKQVSAKRYIKKPLCYNCKKNNISNCCKKQLRKNIYPFLKSPDYIFKDDFIPRYLNKSYLAKHNLHIF